jgi:hypothetical protein
MGGKGYLKQERNADIFNGWSHMWQPAYTLYSMLACLCVFSKPFLLFSIVVGPTSATAAAWWRRRRASEY